ncbi:helix-turn-helix domain-containing protein [Snuella sedimenti]|uniref:Helix-turn-helix transcriptional regulator n=1 Tax=Snuella sedimenti TaxID=2798802 RepID=A0A8J7LNR2_9FLAO|nr:AraC family transcriptional regulator [Snuella sedimenti]MBJ6368964.1 helix-turn-helix transcriptional regulator [Snuella sedimenti]
MTFRFIGIFIFLLVGCTKTERPDIVFDDFEKGRFINWNKQGQSFVNPINVDSTAEPIKNVHGKYVAYSNFEGEGESRAQGKLVSHKFKVNRKYISFLIAGGNHNIRECVNLIINNKIVKVATGENDMVLREVVWDVSALEGREAVIEVVDAMASPFESNALGFIIADNFTFSDKIHQREVVFEDFENGTYSNWQVEGEAFEVPRNRTNVYYPISANGFNGEYFAFSFGRNHDKKQGKLRSKPFKINHDYVTLLVGGGNHPKLTCVNLLVNDSIVCSATGSNDGNLRPHQWDVKGLKGMTGTIEIVDHFSDGWGHIMVDDIIFIDEPKWYMQIWVWAIIFLLGFVGIYIIPRLALKSKSNIKISPEDDEALEKLKSIIRTSEIYLNNECSIQDIITVSESSEEETNRLFSKSEYGSLINYLNSLRVEAFKQQLQDPKNEAYTMISIAEQCGFSSKTSFYRTFKAITNITPSEYKNSLK